MKYIPMRSALVAGLIVVLAVLFWVWRAQDTDTASTASGPSFGRLSADAAAAYESGDLHGALANTLAAAIQARREFGPHSAPVAATVQNLGLTLALAGYPNMAEDVLEWAVRAGANGQAGSDEARLAGQMNLALVYVNQGKFRESRRLFEHVVEEASRSPDAAVAAQASVAALNLSVVRTLSGDQSGAPIPPRLVAPNATDRLHHQLAALNNRAFAAIVRGDYGAVTPLFAQARQIAARAADLPDQPAASGAVIWVSYLIIDETDGSPPIDCSMFIGGTGPFNPDPQTGGDMAQCGPFGTKPTFGMWGNWNGGDGDPGGGGSGGDPGGGGSGGGGDGPDLPEPDDVPENCDECLDEHFDLVLDCLSISIDPGPEPWAMLVSDHGTGGGAVVAGSPGAAMAAFFHDTRTFIGEPTLRPPPSLFDRCMAIADKLHNQCQQRVNGGPCPSLEDQLDQG